MDPEFKEACMKQIEKIDQEAAEIRSRQKSDKYRLERIMDEKQNLCILTGTGRAVPRPRKKEGEENEPEEQTVIN